MNDLAVWLTNTNNAPLEVQASELLGFGTGSFVEQVVSVSDILIVIDILCFKSVSQNIIR